MTLKTQKRCTNHCQNKHCFPSQNFIGNTWSLSSREGEGRLPPRTLQVAFQASVMVTFVWKITNLRWLKRIQNMRLRGLCIRPLHTILNPTDSSSTEASISTRLSRTHGPSPSRRTSGPSFQKILHRGKSSNINFPTIRYCWSERIGLTEECFLSG